MKKLNVIKKLVNYGIILIGFNLFTGCVKLEPYQEDYYDVSFQVGLPLDMNGYYHLTLDRTKWQTLHRVSGVVTNQDNNFYQFVLLNQGLLSTLVKISILLFIGTADTSMLFLIDLFKR